MKKFGKITVLIGATAVLALTAAFIPENEPPKAPPSQPADTNHYFAVLPSSDKNPNTPKTVRYDLTAGVFNWEIAPGKSIEAWGYNAQVPGPVLKARRGDTLVVRLTNTLSEPTTIHWHGLRIPSPMDGTEEVQKAVMPGETFEYKFVLPDAGTYWYHPHTNETEQMERGMYGAILVEDENDPVTDGNRFMLIDDMKLTAKNEFKKPGWFLSRWMERHDGREGETLLVNGKENPVLEMAAGQTQRWRFVNTSSARYFLLHLGGRPFKIIGTDGGLLEAPRIDTQLLITPGERFDIAVGPFESGETIRIESLPFDRGTGKAKREHFATLQVGAPQPSLAAIPEQLSAIPAIATADATVNRHIKLHGKRNWKEGVDFTINDEMHLHDQPVRSGELQVWEITNPSMLDHPFHLHGFFFQVLEANGQEPAFKAWKDTYNVPRKGSIKIAWMPDERTGKWMYHCHILEHTAAGMMAHFEVVDNDAKIAAPVKQHGHEHRRHH